MTETSQLALSKPGTTALPFCHVPVLCIAATASVIGSYAGDYFPLRPDLWLLISICWLTAGTVLHLRASGHAALSCLLFAVVSLSVLNWQVRQSLVDTRLTQLAAQQEPLVRLRTVVDSIPAVHERSRSGAGQRRGASLSQTRFQVSCCQILTDEDEVAVGGQCLVYVEGDLSGRVVVGDELVMTGRLSWPDPPSNPGEFDFGEVLRRRRISALLFVAHPDAVVVSSGVSSWDPRRMICHLRANAMTAIRRSVSPEMRSVALALLLGERHEIPAEVEEAFIASGTMHLLAISGLHIGILCVFLLRTCNLLKLSRRRALVVSLCLCVAYAALADSRPSVVRATAFYAVFVISELTLRRQRMATLIAITALGMVVWMPEVVFDSGAWLSFLSVVALSLIGDRQSNVETRADKPVAISVRETLVGVLQQILIAVGRRYRQMAAILILTTPIVVYSFHVLSPVGMLVNILLIPLTAFVLVFGFLMVIAGVLLPGAGAIPGAVFSAGLRVLTGTVDFAADLSAGHVFVSGLDVWCIATYYGLIFILLAFPTWRFRRLAALAVPLLAVVASMASFGEDEHAELRCTVLNVGHGNATVVELPNGDALVIDAGSMMNSDRAADTVRGYLWSRGYTSINGLLISHADSDHYNAAAALLRQFRVGEVLCSQSFLDSTAPDVEDLLDNLGAARVPVRLTSAGDSADIAGVRLSIDSAPQTGVSGTDNEKSLVVAVEFAGRRILIPGDLEGPQAGGVLRRIGTVDVLVSPHHGAASANVSETAEILQPEHVVVSSGRVSQVGALSAVYHASDSLRFTHDSGAITIVIREDGRLRIDEVLAAPAVQYSR